MGGKSIIIRLSSHDIISLVWDKLEWLLEKGIFANKKAGIYPALKEEQNKEITGF